jgi:hypothetical protein
LNKNESKNERKSQRRKKEGLSFAVSPLFREKMKRKEATPSKSIGISGRLKDIFANRHFQPLQK